jgi:hypothetical protein
MTYILEHIVAFLALAAALAALFVGLFKSGKREPKADAIVQSLIDSPSTGVLADSLLTIIRDANLTGMAQQLANYAKKEAEQLEAKAKELRAKYGV